MGSSEDETMSSAAASALGFEERAVYYPKERPGYTGWVSMFPLGGDEQGLVSNEIRRGQE